MFESLAILGCVVLATIFVAQQISARRQSDEHETQVGSLRKVLSTTQDDLAYFAALTAKQGAELETVREDLVQARVECAAKTRAHDKLLATLEERERRIRELTRQGDEERYMRQYTECILSSITSGVVVVDILSRIALINREAEKILERPAKELVGELLINLPELGELLRLINQIRGNRPLYSRSNEQYEVQLTNFAGKSMPLGVSVNALVDDEQVVLGYVVICRDLTERKRLHAKVDRAERLSSLGTMASGVAHNFNNILAAILGRVQLLLRYPDRTNVVEGLKTIERSALDGAATVKRIQDFARKRVSDEGFAPVDFDPMVRDAVSFTSAKWKKKADETGAHYEVLLDLQSDSRVRGAASELREVIINLLINAVDAMPEGGTITLSSRNDGEVHLRVIDTGLGMVEEVRQRIFDPFFTTKGAKGTGLGLSESYGIVKRHRGTITVDSVPNEGSTFHLRLPLDTTMQPVVSAVAAGGEKLRPIRIVVVDDDATQTEILSDMLGPEGHQVRTANSGDDALALFDEEVPDVLITDLGMPGMSGWKLAERVKERAPDCRVIVFTGWGAEFAAERVARSGVDLCLAKPLTVEKTLDALRRVMNAASARPGTGDDGEGSDAAVPAVAAPAPLAMADAEGGTAPSASPVEVGAVGEESAPAAPHVGGEDGGASGAPSPPAMEEKGRGTTKKGRGKRRARRRKGSAGKPDGKGED